MNKIIYTDVCHNICKINILTYHRKKKYIYGWVRKCITKYRRIIMKLSIALDCWWIYLLRYFICMSNELITNIFRVFFHWYQWFRSGWGFRSSLFTLENVTLSSFDRNRQLRHCGVSIVDSLKVYERSEFWKLIKKKLE